MDQKETVLFFAAYDVGDKLGSSSEIVICDKKETINLFLSWLKKIADRKGEVAFTNVKIIR